MTTTTKTTSRPPCPWRHTIRAELNKAGERANSLSVQLMWQIGEHPRTQARREALRAEIMPHIAHTYRTLVRAELWGLGDTLEARTAARMVEHLIDSL